MAPPRQQRTTTVADDSRSEASSGPREPKTTTGKGRKGAYGTNSSSRVDGRASAVANVANTNVTSIPAQQQALEELPNVSPSFFTFGLYESDILFSECAVLLPVTDAARSPGPTCPSTSSTPTATPTTSLFQAPTPNPTRTSSSRKASDSDRQPQ